MKSLVQPLKGFHRWINSKKNDNIKHMFLGPETRTPESGQVPDDEQRRKIAEARMLSDRERGGGLPFEGEFYYLLLKRLEVGEGGDISDIVEASEKVMAYLEGLEGANPSFLVEWDPKKADDISTRQALVSLRNLFFTTEGASKRPNAPYVEIGLRETVEAPLVESDLWKNDHERHRRSRLRFFERLNEERLSNGRPEISDEVVSRIIEREEARLSNEYLARGRLLALLNHVEARGVVDFAFRQRMATCENPDQASKLGGEIRATSPDGPSWEAFFHTESNFGSKVDEVFEEIVKFGLTREEVGALGMEDIPDEVRRRVCGKTERGVYADGFKDNKAFAYWLKHLLNKADGRLDVVWAAWRVSLLWEIPEYLGVDVDPENSKYRLAAPPVGNALMGTLMHTLEKRRHELGINAKGERFQVEKFISHSGLPLTIEAFPNLCLDFLHETNITFSQDYLALQTDFGKKLREVLGNIRARAGIIPEGGLLLRDKSLSKKVQDFLDGKSKTIKLTLWDLRFLGDWRFSDSTFPWLISDQPESEDAEAGELPMGAFGAWLSKRSRAFSVWSSKEGQGIKDIPRLDSLAAPEFYTAALRNWTKLLGAVSESTPPEKNPRAWVLLAWLVYYRPGLSDDLASVEKEMGVRVGRASSATRWVAGAGGDRNVTLGRILYAARESGWIREQDEKWIRRKLEV